MATKTKNEGQELTPGQVSVMFLTTLKADILSCLKTMQDDEESEVIKSQAAKTYRKLLKIEKLIRTKSSELRKAHDEALRVLGVAAPEVISEYSIEYFVKPGRGRKASAVKKSDLDLIAELESDEYETDD